jgi:flagellar protein FlaG
MDIINMPVKDSVTPVVVKVLGAADTSKPLPQGNSLPALGQIPLPRENSQGENSASRLDSETLRGLVDQVNNALSTRFSNLKFTVAEGSDIRVIRIEDTQTGELIRQIPSEEMVAIAGALQESQQGTMFEEKA